MTTRTRTALSTNTARSEERVTFSPIAAPLGVATQTSDTGTAPTDMACDQSATHTAAVTMISS